MICPKCGRNVPDGMQCPCGAPVLSSNPAVNVIKTVGSSPKFFAATILYSAAILLNLIATFSMSQILDQMYYYAANYGVDPEVFYPMMNMLEGSSILGAVLTSLPSILIAVGMWLFYASCRNTQNGNVSTTGLTICKVLMYVNLVFMCFAALMMLIVFIAVIVASGNITSSMSYYGDTSGVMAGVAVVLGVLLVFAVGVIALYVVMTICCIKTINRIKASALMGTPDNRVPGFLTGYLMVIGIITGIGGVISLITSPLAGLGSLASAACLILISMVLSEYRSRMTMLLFPPVQPMYNNQNMPPYDNNQPPQQ